MNVMTPIASVNLEEVDRITASQLVPIVRKIDDERFYPEDIMRSFATAGTYASHLGGPDGNVDLGPAILAMARASEECLSTGFCMWCQDTLGWYIASSDNDFLKTNILPKVAKGEALGGTGMSNPMKAMGEIEPMRLNGERVEGGYRVKGLLPWVSNLVEDGYFGSMFHVAVDGEEKPRRVMAIFHAAWEGITLRLDHEFVAMGGTATCNVQMRDVFVPDEYLLGDPADAFVKNMRSGFTLLQCGMAAGIIKNCIDLMKQVQGSLGHVNKYLQKQPEDIEAAYNALVADVLEMAKTPYDSSNAFYKRVLEARLAGGELAVEAAHWAQLHCGARGYVTQGAAQRRLREAYFVAIVTPATKHLRKLLAELDFEASEKPPVASAPKAAEMENVLVTPSQLQSMMAQSPTVIIDTRSPEQYAAGHIPGAVNLHDIFTYLATSSGEGLKELSEKFANAFGAAGLSGEETAVIYEQSMDTGFGQSCRGYFLLSYLGYPKVSVLHGGYDAWLKSGGVASTAPASPQAKTFPIDPAASAIMVDAKAVLDVVQNGGAALLDVRDVDEWVGESSSPYGKDFCPRKGRIPGAKWIEWYRMMKPGEAGAVIKSPEEILAECATVGLTPDTPVVLYCFKGARASNTFLALKEAGFRDVKMYFGSWNEWSRDPQLPIESGLPYAA